MKLKSIGIIALLTFQLYVQLFAQQPTKEEMEEMRKAMEEMQADPEMQKAMKQLGLDMSTVENAMNAVETDGFGAYYEFEEFMTPKKDDARIAAIQKKPLTSSELQAHLVKAERRVDAALQVEDRNITLQLLNSVSSYPPDSLSEIASGLWMMSSYIPATYIMGKASQKDPNPDNLNNYAAFLVMLGGEDLALPLLQKLNREFPKNSTIQNNIGQAWFGLGDLVTAETYLDSAIMTIAWHPQANMTKAVIQEKKGDKTGAVESLKKSVQGGYSTTKEDMLRKLGYKLDGKNVDDDFNMPADPLGFDKWIARIPIFPKNHKEQLDLYNEWEEFYKDVKAEEQRLTVKLNRINQEVQDKMRIKGTNQLDIAKALEMTKSPYLSAKANHVLKYYTDEKNGKFSNQWKRLLQNFSEFADTKKRTEEEFRKLVEVENAKCEEGEGKGDCPSPCPIIVPVYDNMINTQNSLYEILVKESLELWSSQFEAAAYFFQYSVSDPLLIEQYELFLKVRFVKEQLTGISPAIAPEMGILSCMEDDSKKPATHKLADWNDLHCDKDIRFSVPGTGYWKFTCNTTELHLEPLLLPFELHYTENFETGKVISASAAVSIKREIGGVKTSVKVGGGYDATKGTVKLEGGLSTKIGDFTIGDKDLGGMPGKVSAGGGGFIEFDKNGISDLGFKGGIEAKPDLKVGEKNNESDVRVGKIETGGKWSWNAGPSGVAKGTLNDSINPSNFSAPSKK
jgi:tetratricopeptide (TPR) repeat protein